MTFEELQKANDTIRTTNIKGKEYAEVNQRIKAFRMLYPEGTIHTQMISNEDGVCIFRAKVYANSEATQMRLLGVGHAYEKEGSSNINRTSYIENCETSAVGRALGMAGFGIDTSVASAEEVQNAILNQNEGKEGNTMRAEPEIIEHVPLARGKVTETNVDALKMLISETGSDANALLSFYEVDSFQDLTIAQWKQAMDILTRRKGGK